MSATAETHAELRTFYDLRRFAAETPAGFVAFDLLALGDESFMDRPLSERRAALVEALGHLDGSGPCFLTRTTEDPADDFRPDTGTITSYQSPGGPGVRLDGAVYAGAQITPYFDSLLVKLTTRGPDLVTASLRAQRALREFRVRGVKTNADFLRRLLSDEAFLAGGVTTSFLTERPELTSAPIVTDRTSRLLTALGEATVNGLERPDRPLVDPSTRLPALPEPATTGSLKLT